MLRKKTYDGQPICKHCSPSKRISGASRPARTRCTSPNKLHALYCDTPFDCQQQSEDCTLRPSGAEVKSVAVCTVYQLSTAALAKTAGSKNNSPRPVIIVGLAMGGARGHRRDKNRLCASREILLHRHQFHA